MNCSRSKLYRQRLSRLTSLASFLLLVPAPILLSTAATSMAAEQSATGTIRGRVLNAQDGKFLPHAKVTIEGTNIEEYTNDYGDYEIRGVPSGSVVIRAEFPGQTAASATVPVDAGKVTTRDLRFNDKRGTTENGAIVLDEFVVAEQRYKNAQEIAINEERYSVNIKNVVSTDAFGDIPNANVGEFVKFMPGVLISYGGAGGANNGYSDSDASGVSVRGFGPEDTAILIDGIPVSSSLPGSLTRQVSLDMLSINNASRVELIKVPTPDMPSNSIGGQINLITKSAFEYAKPTFDWRVFLNVNTLHPSLGKSVGPNNKKTYKAQPGVEFTAIYPLSPKLGFTVTGFDSREMGQTYRAQPTYTFTGSLKNAAGNTVGLGNPFLSRFQVTDNPKVTERRSANIKVDWKPTDNQRLSVNFQYSTYEEQEAQRRLDMQLVNPSDWGPGYTTMTTLNNSSKNNMTVTTLDRKGDTRALQLQYHLDFSGWHISFAGSDAISRGAYVDQANGHYSEVDMTLQPGLVSFSDVKNGIPGGRFMETRAGVPVDYTTLSNWKPDGTIAKFGDSYNKDTEGLLKADLRRDLDFIPWLNSHSFAFQTGVRRDWTKKEKWGIGTGYRQVLKSGSTFTVADVLDDTYLGQTPGFGMPAQQWASSYKLYELNQKNNIFVEPADGADAVQNWNSYVNQQKSITETTDGAYAELEGQFFRNRLKFIGGSRIERKKRDGRGPYTDGKWFYIKNPDGTLYTDANNPSGVRIDQSTSAIFAQNAAGDALRQALKAKGISIPTHVYVNDTTNVLESQQLHLLANRPVHQSTTGDPSYSLSTSFDVTKKFVVKLAWSRTFGLPNLEDSSVGLLSGSNQFTINQNVPVPADGTLGTIGVANPGLKPSVSDNWDLELAYYTDRGGRYSISGYTKSVTNQIVTVSSYSGSPVFEAVLPALGLDPAEYEDWVLNTSTNSNSKQTTKGVELEAQQDFGFLGAWGKHFQGFATFTAKFLADPPVLAPYVITAPNGNVINVTPTLKTITLTSNRFATAGLQYSDRHFTVQIRGTFRNRNEPDGSKRVTLANGNYLRLTSPPETRIDLNATYRFSEKYSAFVSVRDAFNAKRKMVYRDDQGLYATYAYLNDLKQFGTVVTFGVNGQF